MDADARLELEHEIRRLAESGRTDDATTLAIKRYGPELFGYLLAIARTDTDATDAFSQLSEAVWHSLPRFRWESSFRTWAYAIARHAHARVLRDPERRRDKVSPSEVPGLDEIAEHVRTTTLMHHRTTVKSKLAELREQLPVDDRTLLVLRIERALSWPEIARVMSDADTPTADELARTVVALRKRFERVKQRVRKLAAESGLA